MHGGKKLINSIRSFEPAIEKWKAKPAEELPESVSVSFEFGLTGVLDMKHPRAPVWAKLLDLQHRYNKPIYVEMDPDTNIITDLLIPEASQVMSINEEAEGDIDVVFFTSQARHYLRRKHPDFQEMLNALRKAKESAIAVLVTARREDHEIIDVRPIPKASGAEKPSPLSPPQPDPPVSQQRAQELFDLMASKTCDACNASCGSYPHCIPFKHADDGCYARAHEMCRLMMAEGEAPEKVWIYGGLHVVTSNVHQCDIYWGWHVAPTLMVTTASGPEKYVIDPSLCTGPVTVAAWKALQSDPSAVLRYSTWEPFWSNWYLYPPSDWSAQGIDDPTFTNTNYYLELKCTYLQDDCVTYGPPPYACPISKSSHFIVDRSTYSESEVEALLHLTYPAGINAAFYVVVDGFAPEDLGITAASLVGVPNIKPNLTHAPVISQFTAEAVALDVEDPSHLKRRQRLTWTYKVTFTGTNGFTFPGDVQSVTLSTSISTVSCSAPIYLIKQPNPYEIDGQTSWLSTDLRVFRIKQNQSKFGATVSGATPADAINFIRDVITRLNSGNPANTGGQTFDNDLDPNATELALNQVDAGGTAIFNFAIAKVRYRGLVADAQMVRVFFRLCPALSVSIAYDPVSTYRTYSDGVLNGQKIALLGMQNNNILTIPCFASPRVSPGASMTTQLDTPNVQTIPHDAGGLEVVRYFGCWLDTNHSGQKFFPLNPSNDGPYAGSLYSVFDLVRNQHQCLLAEIAFDHAPILTGAAPSTSDKLAQRNLSLVMSANPGDAASRRIPNTFELKPTLAGQTSEPDVM